MDTVFTGDLFHLHVVHGRGGHPAQLPEQLDASLDPGNLGFQQPKLHLLLILPEGDLGVVAVIGRRGIPVPRRKLSCSGRGLSALCCIPSGSTGFVFSFIFSAHRSAGLERPPQLRGTTVKWWIPSAARRTLFQRHSKSWKRLGSATAPVHWATWPCHDWDQRCSRA